MTETVSERLSIDNMGIAVEPTKPIANSSDKPAKIGRIRWVGEMNQALTEGLADSQWLADVEADQISAGRQICLDLWPFIRHLPNQIKAVNEKLPEGLEPAKLFLNSLADEERHYQELYIKQCELAGLSRGLLLTTKIEPSHPIVALSRTMDRACLDGDVVSGVQAIVAAELADTQFARAAKSTFENYFELHAAEYSEGRIDEGLSWLRLHAKPNTRNALWMNRMLVALSQESDSSEWPETVKEILKSIFSLWRVEQSTVSKWLDSGVLR